VAAALAVASILASACSSERKTESAAPARQPRVLVQGASGPVAVRVEVARTPAEQRRGLMHRRELAPDAGMLFVFAREEPHSFWMENTFLPLDLLFIGDDGVVRAVVERAPLGRESDDGGVSSRYVLEVNRGWSRAHGVKPGAKVTFEGVLY
jgi:uncharacterized membrane protein (UPF0127 family)